MKAPLPLALAALALASACADRSKTRSNGPDDAAKAGATSSDDATSDDAKGEAGTGDGLRIVGVPQLVPVGPDDEFYFHPTQPLIAGMTLDGCGVWDVRTGNFVAEFGPETPVDEVPCLEWYGGGVRALDSADGARTVEPDVDELQILDGDGKELARLGCGGCGSYLDPVWAPKGHLLAALTEEPLALEVWDVDAGKRLHHERLLASLDPAEISGVRLAWSEAGIVALVEHLHRESCNPRDEDDPDYDPYYEDDDCWQDEDSDDYYREQDAVSSFWWASVGAPVDARLALLRELSVDELTVDPGLRWILARDVDDQYDDPRMGSSEVLSVFATTDFGGALSWEWSEWEGGEEVDVDRVGQWRVDASTQWIEARTIQYYYDYGGSQALAWSAIVAEPSPGVYGQTLLEREEYDGDEAELEIYGAASGSAMVEWWVSEAEGGAGASLAVAGCEALEAAPLLDFVLADCGGQLALVEPGVASRPDQPGRVHLQLPVDAEADWAWGREGWLAVIDLEGHLIRVDPRAGQVDVLRDDAVEFAPVALAAEQGRLGVMIDGKLELLDMSSGATLIAVARDPRSGQAALSPDGQRLASIDEGVARIRALDGGALLASWDAPEMTDLAWRQDGEVMLVGVDVPMRWLDPDSGELIRELDDEPYLSILIEGLDPSWRWAVLEDGRMLRTLDEQTLRWGPGWARLDSGVYEGAPPQEELTGKLYRVESDDPFAVPRFTVAQLKPWLERPGLVTAFFAGEALAPPTIRADELAKLEEELGIR